MRNGPELSEFRRPLGLVLAGGGALGAWQAGFLQGLVKAGLRFDKVLGFSAGALSGAGYFLGRVEELVERWRNVDNERILRFKPRLRKPFSLFDGASLWAAVESAKDEERARKGASCELIVVSLPLDDRRTVYSRFTPGGSAGWDGPLAARLVASSAIPGIFPPVTIGSRTFVDGGIPGEELLTLKTLEDCRDVIIAEMVRPEEVGLKHLWPWDRYEQEGRDLVRRQIDSGIASLRALSYPPRIFRLSPSRVLGYGMLSFRSRVCAPALELGLSDAQEFLRQPVAAD